MKQVLLVRHAKSSWTDLSLDDIDRPLNPRGLRDAPFMASYCRSKKLIPELIATSPARRATATARFFQKEFESELTDFLTESDLYFGGERDWLHLIESLDDAINFAAFFSHNPTITHLTNTFTSDFLDNVPTCGVVHLVSNIESWSEFSTSNTVLKNYYFPKLVRES